MITGQGPSPGGRASKQGQQEYQGRRGSGMVGEKTNVKSLANLSQSISRMEKLREG